MIWLAKRRIRRVLFVLSKSFVSQVVCSSSSCHSVAQKEQMMQEVCAGVQFVTTTFPTVCSSSCQQGKKQSLISVECLVCSIPVFVLHRFMQGLDTDYWHVRLLLNHGVLKLKIWLL